MTDGFALVVVALAVAVTCGACAGETRDAIAAGSEVYDRRCAACHDLTGGIGPRLSPSVVRSYSSREALVDYLGLAMPYDEPGVLTDREYRDLAAYLFARADSVDGT